MANIKTIVKKLVNNGYSEDKLMLMTEKEIREAYKDYKVVKEESTMKNNTNTTATNNSTTNKEVITMTNEMIKEMKQLARNYDAFTHCIDDYSQQKEAEKHNRELETKFVEVANKMGINATASDLYEIASGNEGIDEAIEAYIKSHEIRIISETLTQEKGELTFVELSPEQKLEISKVLDDQLQDINYSSWFEEENGVFKLYGGWVDEDSAVKEEYYFNGNKLIKIEREEIDMNNNATAIKEEITMKTSNTTEVVKEDIIMVRTVQELIDDALNIKKISNKRYVTRLMLRNKYKELTGEIIRDKRSGMIKKLQEYIESNTVIEDNFCNDKASKDEPDNTIIAGDFCRDNVPESIEEPTPELSQNMAAKILKKVICQADTNKAHNFISNWMLTSAISEVLFGTPLKEKKNGNVIEHWKGFSKEQNKMLAYIHKEFVNKSGFVAKRKDGTIVGYTIPAKVLVWGRHKYLNKACIYKVIDKYGKALAEYLVSVNGIKNAATGKTMSLTEDDYNTLDTKCVFIK